MITQVLLPAGLAFIMLTLGLKLDWRDLGEVVAKPKALLAGLSIQLALLPALAAAILLVSPLPVDLAIGLVVLSVCPGGVTSNMFTAMARGDTGLSIALTAISTLACLVTIPLATGAALAFLNSSSAATDLNMWSMTRGMLVVATVPVILGMGIRYWAAATAGAIEQRARPIASAIFVLIVLATFASQWAAMLQNIAVLGAAVLALNLGIIVITAVVARLSRLDAPRTLAIVIESSVRNAGLGILVSLALLDTPVAALPCATYAMMMNISALCIVGATRTDAFGRLLEAAARPTGDRGA